jgi:hypothetical protein
MGLEMFRLGHLSCHLVALIVFLIGVATLVRGRQLVAERRHQAARTVRDGSDHRDERSPVFDGEQQRVMP